MHNFCLSFDFQFVRVCNEQFDWEKGRYDYIRAFGILKISFYKNNRNYIT